MFSALQHEAPGWTDGAQRRAWVALWERTADQPWARDKIASMASFEVELVHAGTKPVGVIQVARHVTGASIAEARALVDSLPRVLGTGLSLTAAESIEKRLLEAGATVRLR